MGPQQRKPGQIILGPYQGPGKGQKVIDLRPFQEQKALLDLDLEAPGIESLQVYGQMGPGKEQYAE
jgi:hypothetical protein